MLAALALKSRDDVERHTAELDQKPFWRFRGRQKINSAITHAKRREESAISDLR